ncbi:hypothetical protein [uncultured Salinisphaera sp.]|uniref:hypothetical protein n=1 Tax=uncultured Salinisphaera sp. TaxID=359372 RepID=UPI0032B2027D|tara:strand:- start:47 stop:265 length:219 start_codon:yes stop_codon:yes gene_type:complete
MTNFSIYMVGVILAIGALGYGAFALGVDPMWIGIGVAVLLGLGLMGAARKAGIGRDNPDNARGPNNNPQNRR